MLNSPTVILGLACISVQLSAGIIYTNIDGTAYTRGYTTSAPLFGTRFTTSAAGTLSNISVGLAGQDAAMLDITAGLYTDVSGQPGTLLENWTAAVPFISSPFPLTNLASEAHPFLSQGTQYWFVITQTNSQTQLLSDNSSVIGGIWSGFAINSLTQAFKDLPTPAIELTSSPVPEPATGLMLAAGILMVLASDRRIGAKRTGWVRSDKRGIWSRSSAGS